MQCKAQIRILVASIIILGAIAWLTVSGIAANKDYYVTIGEMHQLGAKAYTRHLRVGGFVVPGSIHRSGFNVDFTLTEQTAGESNPACKSSGPDCFIQVSYIGTEPPPDTFKDEAQALAIGTYGKDGVFHANQIQAKCASKYAPVAPVTPVKPAATTTASASMPQY